MKGNNVSRTAEIVAATRAHHYLHDHPTIFEDPYALSFCGRRWRRIVNNKALRWFVFEIALKIFRPLGLVVIGRARYSEDLLDAAVRNGVQQYVIMGAGFDSFCFRREDLQQTLTVFEVDFPGTQHAKQQRMLKWHADLPDNLHLVGVDFEHETLAEGLRRSDFNPQQPAFFSWLGTTMYLTHEAILATLRSLAEISAPGTQLVFDYVIPDHLLVGRDRQEAEKFTKFVARRGEPLIGYLDPAELPEMLAAVGFRLIENLAPAEQQARYFSDRADGLHTSRQIHYAHVEVM